MDHYFGHIPFASLEGDKRPDKINQNQESLIMLFPKQENNVSIFRVPPLIKIICLFAAELWGSPTNLHMTIFVMGNIHVFHHKSNKLWQVFQIKHFCQNCMCE